MKKLAIVILLLVIALPLACMAQDLGNEAANLVNMDRVVRLFRFYGLVLILMAIIIIALCVTVIRLSHHRRKEKGKKEIESKEKPEEESKKPEEKPEEDSISSGKRDIIKTLSKTEEEIVLELLNNNGKLTQNDLHANTGIPRSTLSRTLKGLEQKKLLEVRGVGVTNLVRLQDWFMEK